MRVRTISLDYFTFFNILLFLSLVQNPDILLNDSEISLESVGLTV